MPSLLIVDDDRSVIDVFERCFENTGVTIHTTALRGEAAQGAAAIQADVVVLDAQGADSHSLSALEQIRQSNPAVPVILITAAGASEVAIESTRLGAMDFLTVPLDATKVRDVIGRAIRISTRIRLNGNGHARPEDNRNSEAAVPAPAHGQPATQVPRASSHAGIASPTLLGVSAAMQEVYKAIGRVAGQNINVLISGESGTGKELVARAIHQHSNRAGNKFLAVNCAAIPESILESELFGHEKGAFTGAVGQRIGKFEECDGGTLFLDEIGDMPLLMQSKVLRAIQEKEFQRVGGNQTISTDVRIVAATNRDLEAMVLGEEFRSDLSFRINGYHIALPGLRDRREDIALLVEHYLRLFNDELGTSITDVAAEAMELLLRYDWPGNVRELQTVLKHAMLHAIGPALLPEFLPAEVLMADSEQRAESTEQGARSKEHKAGSTVYEAAPRSQDDDFHQYVAEQLHGGMGSLYADSVWHMESMLLTDVLRHTNGNQSRAAAILGITRGCLRSKLRLHGIMISSSVAIREAPDGGRKPLALTSAAAGPRPA